MVLSKSLRAMKRKTLLPLSAVTCTALVVTMLTARGEAGCSIDCIFEHVDPQSGTHIKINYPKIPPDKMAWFKADVLPRPDEGLRWGADVLGRGHGTLTPRCNLREICIKLAKAASDHRANAIAYQIFGQQIRVRFLRVDDGNLQLSRSTPPR